MAFDEKHLKWFKCSRSSILFSFIKPQKEYKKPKKVIRIHKKLETMKDCEIEE